MKRPSLCVALLSLALGVAMVGVWGCGGPTGPPRYEVSGTVTYAGEPVPAGEVVFEPDPSKGNSGPQCRATINNGEYCTPSSSGSVPGAVIVRVLGYDGKANPESQMGMQLFPVYETTMELPAEATAGQNIDIPASHGKKRR